MEIESKPKTEDILKDNPHFTAPLSLIDAGVMQDSLLSENYFPFLVFMDSKGYQCSYVFLEEKWHLGCN